MHLSKLKKKHPKAFKAYLEFLVEDCQDDFFVKDGVLCVKVAESSSDDELEAFNEGDLVLEWRPSKKKGDMSVGAGWQERETGLLEEELDLG